MQPSQRPPDPYQPPDFDATIWRYVDLPRYLDMVVRRAWFFCRVSRLSDPFEGSIPQRVVEIEDEHKARWAVEQADKVYPDWVERGRERRRVIRHNCCVSCWHQSLRESAAMWGLYAPNGQGLAIRSTITLLVRSQRSHIRIGAIKYLDYESEVMSGNSIWNPLLTKRKSFEHEQEIRAVLCDFPAIGAFDNEQIETLPDSAGVYVPVDLDRLITEIRVAPNAPRWFHEVVSETTKRLWREDAKVGQSALDALPVY